MKTLAQQALTDLNKAAFIYNNKVKVDEAQDGFIYTLKDNSKIKVGYQSGNSCKYSLV